MHCNRRVAIVLTSGGIDSTTCLAIARAEGFDLFSLTFDYGQRHRTELDAARRVAEFLGVVEHRVIHIDLRQFGGSALTDNIEVPKDREAFHMSAAIPVTYVPARNTIFLSYSLAWAEVLGLNDVFIGVNAVDYSGYPDCRPEFIAAFERMGNLATKMSVDAVHAPAPATARPRGEDVRDLPSDPPGPPAFKIHAPLIELTKSQIIRRGISLGVDYSLTHSCYDPDSQGRACGRCDSCQLRRKGFAEAGAPDPTIYYP